MARDKLTAILFVVFKVKINKKGLLIVAAGSLSACLLGIVFLYGLNTSFQEEVDDGYNAIYSHLFIDPSMNGVAEVKRNVSYCNTTSTLQRLDVYTPKKSDAARPVVVYIHGGGWSSGDKANPFVTEYGAEIVRNDMAFISINYRLAPQDIYPAQNQDVDCALSYIVTHSSELNIDASKLAVIGDSAGGELASMAALTSPSKSVIRAVVDFYGPADIWAQINRTPRPDVWAINYIGSATDEATAKQASPAYVTLTGAPPFLIMHGTNDKTVHYDQSSNFAAQLKSAGADVTLVPVQNASHYFSAKSQPTIKQVEIQMISFLKQHLL